MAERIPTMLVVTTEAAWCRSVATVCPVLMQGCFPEPDKDPVIQIASMVTNQGETTPVVRNVMTLDTCAAIIGSEVMSFKTEQELLKVRHSSAQHIVEPEGTLLARAMHVASTHHTQLPDTCIAGYVKSCTQVQVLNHCKARCTLCCRGGVTW